MKKSIVVKREKSFLDLKVYTNKKNGQSLVLLPKRKMGKTPDKIRVSWFKECG